MNDLIKIEKTTDGESAVCCSNGDYYPYGTSMSFEDDMVDKLGLDAVAVGDLVEFRGFAFVDRRSEHSSTEHTSKSVGIQMTALSVRRKPDDDHAKQLYGD